MGFEELLGRKPDAEKKDKARAILDSLAKSIGMSKAKKPKAKPRPKAPRKKPKPATAKKPKKAVKQKRPKPAKKGKPKKPASKPKETSFSAIAARAERKIESPKHPLEAPSFEENIPKPEAFKAVASSQSVKTSGGFDPGAVERALAKATVIEKKLGIPKTKGVVRVPSGIEGLDELIEGGFEKGSSILIVGSAGTGKTLFGLQFLYNGAVKHNEPGIFISFEEEKESLFRHSVDFGFDFETLEEKNLFRVLEYKPHQVEKLMKEGGGPIRDAIREMGARRLVIDSITSYGLLFKDEYTRRENILGFFELLRKWGCTSVIISELPPKVAEVKEGSVGFLTDAIISLYYAKEEEKGIRVHSCEILKMRGTRHTNKLLAMGFESTGVRIYPEVEVF